MSTAHARQVFVQHQAELQASFEHSFSGEVSATALHHSGLNQAVVSALFLSSSAKLQLRGEVSHCLVPP
uniref:Uncharacterized protein n=1 Tax=Cucumis sativus TaxID=3659 RepID=A0A0A0L813_CUCSA